MQKVMVPPIKSQGIKTKLVPWIASVVPEDFAGRWIEPFLGTGAVALNLAPRDSILSDINPHLINFYLALSHDLITPEIVKDYLEREGSRLRELGEAHYYFIRDRFNEAGDPLDFLFVNRAGFNGMIRFNRKGGFNIPFCRKPNRFAQAYITKITNQTLWAYRTIKMKRFKFYCQDFESTIAMAETGDIIYCDPPYIDRHVDYYGGWNEANEKKLAEMLTEAPAKFILSSWHHNDYRQNEYMKTLWSPFEISMKDHFYHVGGREENRNPMVEALVTNFSSSSEGNEASTTRELADQLSMLVS